MSEHVYIDTFNPGVEKLELEHQDFFDDFRAGQGFENFDDFICNEAYDYAESGDGVTYLVFNCLKNEYGEIYKKELMAYYTLAATSIPYVDRIRLEPEEACIQECEYDETLCGIPALEIKMFAVDYRYQDKFYEYDDESMPLAAWILRNIIMNCYEMITDVLGFKALFLHSVPSAEAFYKRNGFHNAEEYMEPLYSIDEDFQAMYMSLKYVHINRDE